MFALTKPENLTNQVLETKLEILRALPKAIVKDCQHTFLEAIVPIKFRKLNIELGALLQYLLSKPEIFGNEPNLWPKNPDISDYIKDQYQKVFAPNVLSHLRDEDAEVLKEKLLKLSTPNFETCIQKKHHKIQKINDKFRKIKGLKHLTHKR